MRVTFLSRDFPPRIGGIGDHTDHLAGELARRGHEVTVLCAPPAEPRDAFTVRADVPRWDATGIARLLRAVDASRPDAILWQYNPFMLGRRGLAPASGRLARALARGAPLIVLAHELWFPWGREGLKGFLWAVAQRVQTASVLRAADAVVVTTDARARSVARLHRRVRVVPIGANIEPGDAPATDARESLGIPPDAFVVTHFGSVGPGRNLAPAFEAVARLRARGVDARLVLAGNTGPFERPLALNGSMQTTGVLPREQLSSVLAASDVYLHPDPAGPAAGRRGSLTAALAHGLPIVAYRGPDIPPQLQDGRNVVLVEPVLRALADALGAIAADPGHARRLGEAARETYRSVFSWERNGAAIGALLEECAR